MRLNFVKTAAALAVSALATLPAAADSIYVTNQAGGVTVMDPANMNAEKTIDVDGSGPRGLGLTPDGKFLLTANQKTADVAVIDTASGKVVRHIPIGKNPEFLRVLPDGSKAFVTYEPSSKGGPPGKHDDDDEGPKKPAEVAVIDLHDWKVVGSIIAAPETEGIEFTPDHKRLAISNEGDDTVTVYDIASTKLLKTVHLKKYGSRPRGIKLSPDGKHYVVTMENSNNFLVLDTRFKVLKSVPTGTGPYGVSFDKEGKRIFVAAARDAKLEVYDAKTYARIADVPVGKRCWHFSFSPDQSKLLVACGRSNDIEVIDATTYKLTDKLGGFKLPWGIISYPKAYGSLETPAKP